jgi:hypothetical protein
MQDQFSCLPRAANGIRATLSPARIGRYMPAAGGCQHLALRLYLWNARLCEALYLPLQLAEVASRNAISVPVAKRFGPLWFEDYRFENILPLPIRATLQETVRKEKSKRRTAFTVNHIIAALPFGFWVNLMTRPYDKQLWANGVKVAFPYASRLDDRETIYNCLEKMRKLRNDIMHHYAIFDKGPQSEAQNIQRLIGLVCPETEWLAQQISTLSRVINDRPRD